MLRQRQTFFDPKVGDDEDGFTLRDAASLGWNVDLYHASKPFPGRGLIKVHAGSDVLDSNEGRYGVRHPHPRDCVGVPHEPLCYPVVHLIKQTQWHDGRAMRLQDEGSSEYRREVNKLATRLVMISWELTEEPVPAARSTEAPCWRRRRARSAGAGRRG